MTCRVQTAYAFTSTYGENRFPIHTNAVPADPASRMRERPVRLPFFVYGTLRPGEHNHDHFLRGRTQSERPGRLADAALYDGPGYPYAVPESGGVVHGEVVAALPEAYDELLAVLDELEECVPGDPRSLYERVARPVTLDADGTVVRAWVYVAAPAVAVRLRAHGRRIEGGDWHACR